MEQNFTTRLAHPLRLGLILMAALAAACGESAPVVMDGGTDQDAATGMDAATSDGGACTTGCGPASCEDLRASGACPANRVCRPSVNGATCLLECESGYMLNEGTGTCTQCENANCAPSPTCAADEPGSILASCTAQHRVCESPLFEDARCGACVQGFMFDMETGVCVAECEDIPCDEPGAHRERQGDECVCEVRTCPIGSAEGPGGTCVACGGLVCNPEDHELAIYPSLDTDSECACKTALGYYWAADRAARPCDEDGDGWISESAYEAYTSNDETIRNIAQAGCVLREVDRVVLENEYGQRLPIYVCENGFSRDPACSGEPSTLPMVESNRNDSDAHPDRENPVDFPDYGRALHAHEVNSLTKGCVSAEADFDDDGRDDIAQPQTPSPVPTKYSRWSEFAYFTELHTSAYEHVDGEPWGQYVISERSRCTFGQTMDDGMGNQIPTANRLAVGMQSSPEGYWSECARQRDAEFNALVPTPGFDFAQWSCAEETGTCTVPPPPIMTPYGQGTMGQVPITAHGLCDLVGMFGDAPEDFMGMHHHSQFKCVLVGGAMDLRPFVHPPETFGAGGSFELSTCTATADDGDDSPDFTCAPTAVATVSTVGFATARFEQVQNATNYFPTNPSDAGRVRGCIDEYYWGGLCSDGSVSARTGHSHFIGDAEDYGRLLTCDPVTYVYAPELPMSVQPPERSLFWDQGRWE